MEPSGATVPEKGGSRRRESRRRSSTAYICRLEGGEAQQNLKHHKEESPLTIPIHESQDYQSIGQATAQVERIARRRDGWAGEGAEAPILAYTDAGSYSERASRAALQALGTGPCAAPNMAGYRQTPTAAVRISPALDVGKTGW